MPANLAHACKGTWCVVLVVAFATALLADEPKGAIVVPAGTQTGVPVTAKDGPDSTLFMMVRTGPHLSETKITETLRRGLNKAGCQIEGEPTVRSISPSVYEEFENLINQTDQLPTAQEADRFSVRLLPTRDPLWEVRLKSPGQVLKELKVQYEKSGNIAYVPKGPQAGGDLTLIVPGRYALRAKAGDTPIGYDAIVTQLGSKDQTIKETWPKTDLFFVITMRGFRGNRNILLRKIQDANEVPNPFDKVRLGRDLVFVFASLEATNPGPGEVWDGNRMIVNAAGIEGRNIRRVWMYFPLTEDGYKSARDQFRKFESEELPIEIRKNALLDTAGDNEKEISASSAARWYQLESKEKGKLFECKIPIKDIREMMAKHPKAWRLLVWEFDDGKPAAVAVAHPEGGRFYVLEDELKNWFGALQMKAGNPPPAKAKNP